MPGTGNQCQRPAGGKTAGRERIPERDGTHIDSFHQQFTAVRVSDRSVFAAIYSVAPVLSALFQERFSSDRDRRKSGLLGLQPDPARLRILFGQKDPGAGIPRQQPSSGGSSRRRSVWPDDAVYFSAFQNRRSAGIGSDRRISDGLSGIAGGDRHPSREGPVPQALHGKGSGKVTYPVGSAASPST